LFNVSPEAQREFISKNLPAVQEKLAEPVVAYTTFQRSGAYGGMAAAKVSGLASLVMGAAAKKKAGGLPATFLMVLTPTRLHALAFKFRGRGIKVGDELAVWDRATLQTHVDPKSLTVGLTIVSGDERVECEAPKTAVTDDFMAALGGSRAIA
jgi:hypothetical protein